ncbi:MAG: hypothetical protein KBS57_00145 [Alistipes sp.]|nr:hypothetical protein [Candidatus Minthomonas equi]
MFRTQNYKDIIQSGLITMAAATSRSSVTDSTFTCHSGVRSSLSQRTLYSSSTSS